MNAQIIRLYRRIAYLLFPPPQARTSATQDRRYLLTALALLSLPSMILTSQWSWIDRAMLPALWSAAIGLILAIALNRFGRFNLAALVMLTAVEIPIYAGALVSFNPVFKSIDQVLVFVCAPILVACLICTLPYAALFTGANLVAIVVVPVAFRHLPITATYFSLFCTLMISAVGLFTAVLQHRHQRKIEQQATALSESETRYRDLFDAASETIIVQDDSGQMIEANAAFERMFGVSFARHTGDHLLTLLCPDEAARIGHLLAQPTGEPVEVACLHADSTRLTTEFRINEHLYRGRRMRVISIRDVTHIKSAQEREAALNVEREKVKVLERFIGHMSHDLRTPLAVMKTSVYLIGRLLDNPDKSRHYLSTLESQVTHVQQIVEDMLTMTRLNRAEAADFSFAPADLNALLRDLCAEQQANAQRKEQALVFTPLDTLPPVMIEESEFKKMMLHLLDNAMAYTSEQGRIEVATERDLSRVVVTVRDNGIGIGPNDLPHIFEQFYRADAARGTEKGGAGLGLSIVRKIAQVHGGDVTVESEIGRGSSFSVCLPAASSVPTPVPDAV